MSDKPSTVQPPTYVAPAANLLTSEKTNHNQYLYETKLLSKLSFIEKYFIDEDGDGFNPPASSQQIAALENLLGIVLPQDYKDFLLVMNGFEGYIGDSFVAFEQVENVFEYTQKSSTRFFPWAVYIGCNGGLEMYVFDKRTSPFRFGLLPSIAEENDFIPLGSTFEQFLSRLREGNVFDKI